MCEKWISLVVSDVLKYTAADSLALIWYRKLRVLFQYIYYKLRMEFTKLMLFSQTNAHKNVRVLRCMIHFLYYLCIFYMNYIH